MTALRRDRRDAKVRLTKTAVYTFESTGEVLEMLGNCVMVRPDGQLVTVSWSMLGPHSRTAVPIFTAHRSIGRGWRVKMARKLLGL